MKYMICLLVLFLVGCVGPRDPSVVSQNKTTLSAAGEYVGTLPDGRKIVRYEIEMGSNIHNHWVYIVDDSESISVNRVDQHGKNARPTTDVIIDGKRYRKVEE